MLDKIKTIVIVGPTASGKTDLSIKIAKEFNGEIISADSMQVYKGLEIASAAPTQEEQSGIQHYFVGNKEPDSQFTVCDFVNEANDIILDVYKRNKLPIIVGGTGLYVDSLINNIDFGINSSVNIREELNKKVDEIGLDFLYKELLMIDKDYAEKISINDKKRIIRALEIYYSTGKTMTIRHEQSKNKEKLINPLLIGINFKNREILYDRINNRVDLMLKNGLLEEAKKSYQNKNFCGAAQAIGHKELYNYFENVCTLNEVSENLKMQTRRYAKRQLTWFRKNKDINWLYADEDNILEKSINLINKFLVKEK